MNSTVKTLHKDRNFFEGETIIFVMIDKDNNLFVTGMTAGYGAALFTSGYLSGCFVCAARGYVDGV